MKITQLPDSIDKVVSEDRNSMDQEIIMLLVDSYVFGEQTEADATATEKLLKVCSFARHYRDYLFEQIVPPAERSGKFDEDDDWEVLKPQHWKYTPAVTSQDTIVDDGQCG